MRYDGQTSIALHLEIEIESSEEGAGGARSQAPHPPERSSKRSGLQSWRAAVVASEKAASDQWCQLGRRAA